MLRPITGEAEVTAVREDQAVTTTFLADAEASEYLDQMYAADQRAQGYVAHLTQL